MRHCAFPVYNAGRTRISGRGFRNGVLAPIIGIIRHVSWGWVLTLSCTQDAKQIKVHKIAYQKGLA